VSDRPIYPSEKNKNILYISTDITYAGPYWGYAVKQPYSCMIWPPSSFKIAPPEICKSDFTKISITDTLISDIIWFPIGYPISSVIYVALRGPLLLLEELLS